MDEPSSEEKKQRHTRKPTGIDDFHIIKPISRGAFGQVFLARRRDKDQQFYAIKVVKKTDVVNKNMIEQVVAERDCLAIAQSPYIVNLFYSFQSKERIFLVMEYLIGGDCKSLLHNLGYFDENMSRIYIAQVVLALEYLHKQGIIHRDLKPDNLLISNEGKIKLTDFGLSRLTLERKPSLKDVLGTPSANKTDKTCGSSFFRTPGQVLSLTSNFTFSAARPSQRSRLNSSCSTLHQQMETTPMRHDSPVSRTERFPSTTPTGVVEPPGGQTPLAATGVQATKKRTQFCPKVSQRTFHIDDPPETPLLSNVMHKNIRNRSPEEENQMPVSKRPRHTGLTSEIDALTLKELRSASADDSSRCPLQEINACTPQRPLVKVTPSNTPDSSLSSSHRSPMECKYESPFSKGEDRSPPQGQEFLTPANPSTCAPLVLKFSSPRERAGTILEFLDEKRLVPPAKDEGSDRGRTMSTLTPLTRRIVSPEVPFTSGYASGTNSSGEESGELDHESPDKAIGNLSIEDNYDLDRNERESQKDGTCELVEDRKCNGVAQTTEVADRTGSSGFNESPYNNSPNQDLFAKEGNIKNNQTPSKSEIEISDEIMKTAGEKRRGSFSRRRESGVALLPPSPNVLDKNAYFEDIPVNRLQSDNRLLSPFGLPSKVGHATPRERSMTIEFEGEENTPNVEHLADNSFEKGEVFIGDVSDHLSVDPSSRPRCLTIPFENKIDEECSDEEVSSNRTRDSHMDISLPAITGSPVDVTFKSCASSKGTPGPMEVSHHWHHTSAPLMRTPFRTPKSCRRGNRPQSPPKNRILGTPDYLAPEILLGNEHTPAVDWWSLGVCLYEFLTGVPPFNDDTPELVFSHIMQRDLLWPEGDEALSQHAVGAVESILVLQAEQRPGAKDIKSHPFFSSLDWSSIHSHPPPFVPRPDDITDTTYFNARNTMQNLRMSSFSH